MLQWDLSDTPLATSETPGRVPTQGELLALMVALLMHEDVTYDALKHRVLAMQNDNRSQIIEIFEYRLPELAREFGSGEQLRQRMLELEGIRLTILETGCSQ